MRLFKQLRDARRMAQARPGTVQARQASFPPRYAGALRAATDQRAHAERHAARADSARESDFEPIAGVSLEQYVDISKVVGAHRYHPGRAPELAATRGIDAESWGQAAVGWSWRMRTNPCVARRFNAIYRGA